MPTWTHRQWPPATRSPRRPRAAARTPTTAGAPAGPPTARRAAPSSSRPRSPRSTSSDRWPSIEDIAAAAGVSKPVLYRYFSDKADLYAAVGAWGAELVLERLPPALVADGTLRERVELALRRLPDADSTSTPTSSCCWSSTAAAGEASDPLADGKARSPPPSPARWVTPSRTLGVDAGGAEPWAYGVVGLGLSTGEWWLTPPHDEQRRGLAPPLLVRLARPRGHLPRATASASTRAATAAVSPPEGQAMTQAPTSRPADSRVRRPGHPGHRGREPRRRGAAARPLRAHRRPLPLVRPDRAPAPTSTPLVGAAASRWSPRTARPPPGSPTGDPWGRYRVTGTGRPPFHACPRRGVSAFDAYRTALPRPSPAPQRSPHGDVQSVGTARLRDPPDTAPGLTYIGLLCILVA